MRVLVACEFSGIVREAFAERGHDAWSCDLLESERNGQHIQGDVLHVLDRGWDLMIAHPPCTYLAGAGLNWINRQPGRRALMEKSLDFIRILLGAPIPHIALENPVGVISSHIRKPDQIIQPYWFGHPFQKRHCLWLAGLPKLTPTNTVDKGEIYVTKSGKSRGGAWTMNLTPSADRWKIRSRTFPGIAAAMAEQWGSLK